MSRKTFWSICLKAVHSISRQKIVFLDLFVGEEALPTGGHLGLLISTILQKTRGL